MTINFELSNIWVPYLGSSWRALAVHHGIVSLRHQNRALQSPVPGMAKSRGQVEF